MVSRDRRDRIVLQKVREQGIRFWHEHYKDSSKR